MWPWTNHWPLQALVNSIKTQLPPGMAAAARVGLGWGWVSQVLARSTTCICLTLYKAASHGTGKNQFYSNSGSQSFRFSLSHFTSLCPENAISEISFHWPPPGPRKAGCRTATIVLKAFLVEATCADGHAALGERWWIPEPLRSQEMQQWVSASWHRDVSLLGLKVI